MKKFSILKALFITMLVLTLGVSSFVPKANTYAQEITEEGQQEPQEENEVLEETQEVEELEEEQVFEVLEETEESEELEETKETEVLEETQEALTNNEEPQETKVSEQLEETNESEELTPAFNASQTVDGVTITVSAEEGVFPEDATLSVKKVSVEELNEVLDELRDEDVNLVSSFTFDIKVLDAQGNEIQPEDGKVKVTFTLQEAINPNLDSHVYHIEDNEEISKEDVVALDIIEEEEKTLTVETDGFSYYTVEFTYNNLQYVMNGGEEIPLTTILAAVGIEGNVDAVEVSNEELFSASNATGEWVITSHKAFNTDEWMKVTIDGVVFEIKVTDDTYTEVTNLTQLIDAIDAAEQGGAENTIVIKNTFAITQTITIGNSKKITLLILE